MIKAADTMGGYDKFKNLKKVAISELHKGVDAEVEGIMQDAQVEVPKETGALHDTIRRDKTKISKIEGISVKIRAGGSKAPYGIYVHEDLNARHASPTKAKFLTDPFKRKVQGMGKRLSARINSVIKKVGF